METTEQWFYGHRYIYEEKDIFDPATYVDEYDPNYTYPNGARYEHDYTPLNDEKYLTARKDRSDDEDYEYKPIMISKLHDREFALPTSASYHLKPLFKSFPEGSLQLKDIEGIVKKERRNEALDITVTYQPKQYRVIRCTSEHTFEDLHMAIQDAFNLDNDHLYVFYPNSNKRSNACMFHYEFESDNIYELYAGQMLLGDFYPNGPVFTYLFDFGDQYEFDLSCKVASNENPANYRNPAVIKSVGDDIEQYPVWE
jgi:hypothetical protein